MTFAGSDFESSFGLPAIYEDDPALEKSNTKFPGVFPRDADDKEILEADIDRATFSERQVSKSKIHQQDLNKKLDRGLEKEHSSEKKYHS